MEKIVQALITGGEGGLAQAIAAQLSSTGMEVYAPGRAELDVTDAEAVDAYVGGLEDLDLVVCNAGIIADSTVRKMTESQWDAVLETNLKGSFLVARAALKKMMKRRSGQIIFISSHAASQPSFGQANYAAAKAGLEGMAKSMARELGSRNIRVNVLVPGFMETKMTRSLPEKVIEMARQNHVLGRFSGVGEAAKFIDFLHHHLIHTSGQVFRLDSRIVK